MTNMTNTTRIEITTLRPRTQDVAPITVYRVAGSPLLPCLTSEEALERQAAYDADAEITFAPDGVCSITQMAWLAIELSADRAGIRDAGRTQRMVLAALRYGIESAEWYAASAVAVQLYDVCRLGEAPEAPSIRRRR